LKKAKAYRKSLQQALEDPFSLESAVVFNLEWYVSIAGSILEIVGILKEPQ
jgi:hypothetical protein